MALALVAPLAAAADAGVLEIDIEDVEGDVKAHVTSGNVVARRPGADMLNFSSRVVGDELRLYLRVAGPPKAPDDAVEMRIWFKDSTNGSFDAVDVSMWSGSEPDERLEIVMRRDRYENETRLAGRFGLENGTMWIFAFDHSILDGATCLDPLIMTYSRPKPAEGPHASDALALAEPACVQGAEPDWAMPGIPAPSFGFPSREPAPEPPGSAATPAPMILAAAALVLAGALRRR